MQTGALDLRLVRAKEAGDGYALLGVARVMERRSDNQVLLDPLYIAPQTRIDATQQLSAHATLLHGLIHQRTRAFAARMGQLSHGISEMADFLMLQALNRAEPVFRQHALAPNTHPKELYLACLQLAGDLSTFTSDARFPNEYPPYRHDDLHATFVPVITDLRRMLSTVLERNAIQIELVDRSHGVRTAVFPDAELARNGELRARGQRADAGRAAALALPGAVEAGPVRQAARSRQPAAARRRPALAADGAAPAAVPRRLSLLRARPRRRAVEAAREERQPRCMSPATFPRSSSSCGRSANERAGSWCMDPSAINDPFADRDDQTRTFIKPDPRGRGTASRSAETSGIDVACPDAAIPDVGLNPLVALANRLLLLVPQLRATRQVADPAALRTSLAQGIRDFARARRARHRA